MQDEYGQWHLISEETYKEDQLATPFTGIDVLFRLYTPKNPTKPQDLIINDSKALNKTHFNAKLPTRILIHGWNSKSNLMEKFADAYFVKSRYNINFIGVDWTKGSNIVSYLQASYHVETVGAQVALFIDFLVENGMDPALFAMIGHSLGAHAMGHGKHKVVSKRYT